VAAICAASAVGAALAAAAPTGTDAVDLVWRALLGAVVPLAASRARRWALLVLTATAGVLTSGAAFAVALAGFVAAMATAVIDRRDRVVGALAGALAINALLRADPRWFHGFTALLGVAAVALVLWSGYTVSRSRTRRIVRRALAGLVVVLGLAAAIGAVALLLARTELEAGVAEAQSGLDAARAGDIDAAEARFDGATARLEQGRDRIGAWWARPARAVPVLGQHVRATAELADAGTAVAAAALEAALVADADRLRPAGGQVDVDALRAAEAPLVEASLALDRALATIDEVRSPWLLSPLASRIDDLGATLAEAQPPTETALTAVRIAPGLLGADEPRRYLVLFTTPAESRGLGGFVGSWAIVGADAGRLTLDDTGRIGELANRPDAGERTLEGFDDLLARYEAWDLARYLQDVTAPPDLPTVAELAMQLFPQAGTGPLDGVIVLDPAAVAAIVSLTGPIDVPGLVAPLPAGAVESYLLVEQYAIFDGDDEAREDALDVLVRTAFDRFVTVAQPSPRQIADAFSRPVAESRALVWSAFGDENAGLEQLGLGAPFPAPEAGLDLLSVRTANANPNKIDVYLQRTVDYTATIDPETGALAATATVTLAHDPPPGLPEVVVGNRFELPPGTNFQYVSVYTPRVIERMLVDGVPVSPDLVAEELGWNVYVKFVVVPPNGQATLTVEMSGTADPDAYRFAWSAQPTVIPDQLRVIVDAGAAEPLVEYAGPGGVDLLLVPGATVIAP